MHQYRILKYQKNSFPVILKIGSCVRSVPVFWILSVNDYSVPFAHFSLKPRPL